VGVVDPLTELPSTMHEEAHREKRDTDKAPPPEPGIQFISHNAPGGPTLSADFERIVERVFSLPDALSQYDRLEKALKLGDERTDKGSLKKALDEAEYNARMAHKLYVNAKIEKVGFEKDFAVLTAPMMLTATERLQAEKDKGTRSKQITDGDVQAMAAQMYPDAYRDHAIRVAKIAGMVEHTQKLSELWSQRCSGLQTQLNQR